MREANIRKMGITCHCYNDGHTIISQKHTCIVGIYNEPSTIMHKLSFIEIVKSIKNAFLGQIKRAIHSFLILMIF